MMKKANTQSGDLIEELIVFTDQMYQHALQGEWQSVQDTDSKRNLFLTQVLSSGTDLYPSGKQYRYLKQRQIDIEALATTERDKETTAYVDSRKKLDQCSYYLKNENQIV